MKKIREGVAIGNLTGRQRQKHTDQAIWSEIIDVERYKHYREEWNKLDKYVIKKETNWEASVGINNIWFDEGEGRKDRCFVVAVGGFVHGNEGRNK